MEITLYFLFENCKMYVLVCKNVLCSNMLLGAWFELIYSDPGFVVKTNVNKKPNISSTWALTSASATWWKMCGKQCCGIVTFWQGSGSGSGSSDPHLRLTDSDTDPGGPKTYGSGTLAHLHHSSKIKSHKKVTKTLEIKDFLTIFAWWWKDPEPDPAQDSFLWLTDPDADPGGPKTYGSYGSGSATLVVQRAHTALRKYPATNIKL